MARALAVEPELLISDEPTGQLDSETGRQIMRLLRTVVGGEEITALAATGPRNVANVARVADGWLPIFFWPERADRLWGEGKPGSRC